MSYEVLQGLLHTSALLRLHDLRGCSTLAKHLSFNGQIEGVKQLTTQDGIACSRQPCVRSVINPSPSGFEHEGSAIRLYSRLDSSNVLNSAEISHRDAGAAKMLLLRELVLRVK